MTHICVSKLTIIVSDNGLSPGRHQAIIWTNAGILLIGPLGTNFSEILIGIQTFSFMKMHLKMSSAKWRQFCLGLNGKPSHLYHLQLHLLTLITLSKLSFREFNSQAIRDGRDFMQLIIAVALHHTGSRLLFRSPKELRIKQTQTCKYA